MSYTFDGTNDQLTGALTDSYTYPFTIACFFKVLEHPTVANPGQIDSIFALGSLVNSSNTSVNISSNNGSNEWAGRAVNSTGTGAYATVTLNIGTDWAGAVMTVPDNSSRNFYLNSFANVATNTVDRDLTGLKFLSIGENLAEAQDFTGQVAECAIWDKVLSESEITSYLSGTTASAIAAENLRFYVPLNEDVLINQGLDTGGDLTASGNAAFSSEHPTITIPGASTRRQRRTALMGLG